MQGLKKFIFMIPADSISVLFFFYSCLFHLFCYSNLSSGLLYVACVYIVNIMVLILAGLVVIPPNSLDLFRRLFVHKAGLNSIVGGKWANSGPVKIDPGGNCPIFWATNYLRLLKNQVEPKQEFSDMASDWLVVVLPISSWSHDDIKSLFSRKAGNRR